MRRLRRMSSNVQTERQTKRTTMSDFRERLRKRCNGSRFHQDECSYQWKGSIQYLGRPGLPDSLSLHCDSSFDRVSVQAVHDSRSSTASWSRLWHMLEQHLPIKQRKFCCEISFNICNYSMTFFVKDKLKYHCVFTKRYEVSTETVARHRKHAWNISIKCNCNSHLKEWRKVRCCSTLDKHPCIPSYLLQHSMWKTRRWICVTWQGLQICLSRFLAKVVSFCCWAMPLNQHEWKRRNSHICFPSEVGMQDGEYIW